MCLFLLRFWLILETVLNQAVEVVIRSIYVSVVTWDLIFFFIFKHMDILYLKDKEIQSQMTKRFLVMVVFGMCLFHFWIFTYFL
jgi:hypothetical protein